MRTLSVGSLGPLACLTVLSSTVFGCSGSAPAASEPPKTTTAVTPAGGATTAPLSDTPGFVVSATPPPPDADGRIRWALAGQQRTEQERARDKYRHPFETLTFFGIKPESKVVELWPGGGWYTAVIAPVVRDRGKLTVTNFAPVGPNGETRQNAQRFNAKLQGAPGVYDQVDVKVVSPPSYLSLGPDGSADVVVTFRNIHNWMGDGYADKVFAAAFQVLRHGGTLGVEEHRAAPGTDAKRADETGYVTEDTVVQLAKGAGFVLDAKSEINANPKDTKDYPKGVWTLPPTLELGATDREKYLAIGESDRMTLRFKKP